jgi:hypothetical protein
MTKVTLKELRKLKDLLSTTLNEYLIDRDFYYILKKSISKSGEQVAIKIVKLKVTQEKTIKTITRIKIQCTIDRDKINFEQKTYKERAELRKDIEFTAQSSTKSILGEGCEVYVTLLDNLITKVNVDDLIFKVSEIKELNNEVLRDANY